MVKAKNLVVFFDLAYMGFGCESSDDFSEDLYAIRTLTKDYDRVLISFSKSFTIYGERLGALSIVTPDEDSKSMIESWMKATALPEYSNPPIHGAKIVTTIMEDAELR